MLLLKWKTTFLYLLEEKLFHHILFKISFSKYLNLLCGFDIISLGSLIPSECLIANIITLNIG